MSPPGQLRSLVRNPLNAGNSWVIGHARRIIGYYDRYGIEGWLDEVSVDENNMQKFGKSPVHANTDYSNMPGHPAGEARDYDPDCSVLSQNTVAKLEAMAAQIEEDMATKEESGYTADEDDSTRNSVSFFTHPNSCCPSNGSSSSSGHKPLKLSGGKAFLSHDRKLESSNSSDGGTYVDARSALKEDEGRGRSLARAYPCSRRPNSSSSFSDSRSSEFPCQSPLERCPSPFPHMRTPLLGAETLGSSSGGWVSPDSSVLDDEDYGNWHATTPRESPDLWLSACRRMPLEPATLQPVPQRGERLVVMSLSESYFHASPFSDEKTIVPALTMGTCEDATVEGQEDLDESKLGF